jgi:hypothetical protein
MKLILNVIENPILGTNEFIQSNLLRFLNPLKTVKSQFSAIHKRIYKDRSRNIIEAAK